MKLTKKLEAEIRKLYEAYWNSYINGDLETYASLLDEEFKFIGSTEAEPLLNKKDSLKLLDAVKEQMAGKAEFRHRNIKVELVDELILVSELCDGYVLIGTAWNFYSRFRVSSLLKKKRNKWKFIHQHVSMPDSKAQEGEAYGLEQIRTENIQLRDAVKRRTVELEQKNRDLEIETALERVRAVAMGMRKPEDLSAVDEIVFKELKGLGFANLRNTEIIIINDLKETLTSYYYSDYGVTGVVEVLYKTNPTVKKWVKDLRKANDAFAEVVIHEKEMAAWRKYREEVGHKPDPKLNKAKEVYYYSYSIGSGGLSISTFKPANAEQIKILERFRNVFNLSYQRYIDIAQAEAQAREAQIQLALERVRARTMAMHHSDELTEVVKLLYQEFDKLKINNESTDIEIGLIDEETGIASVWAHFYLSGGSISTFKFPFTLFEEINSEFQQWKATPVEKRNELFLTTEFSPEQWDRFMRIAGELPELAEIFRPLMEAKIRKWVTHNAYFSHGLLTLQGTEAYSPETQEIQKRFAKVFEQTYTRFLDLQRAEAQAREAQIEVSLERVRSKAMAMHKTEDLTSAVSVVFDELDKLQLGMLRCGIGILHRDKRTADVWTTAKSETGMNIQTSGDEPMDIHPLLQGDFDAWLRQEDFSYVLEGKDLENYYQVLTETNFQLPESASFETIKKNHKQYYYVTPFELGTFFAFRETEFTAEARIVMKRFANVFNLTYKRFLDLQKAEAQSREAQIELGLERVRARAMAMQNSDELKELIGTVFIELTKLDLVLTRCLIMIFDPETNGSTWWMANSEAPSDPQGLYIKYHELPPYLAYIKSWRERKLKWQYILEGSDKKSWDDFIFVETELSRLPDFVIAGMKAPDRVYLSASFNNFGCLNLASLEPLSNEHFDILLRFAKVFDLTYTRFNDLKRAEAQAREAQIELALERVRARAMAMQSSTELSELVDTVFKELTKLDFALTWCIINIIDESSLSNTVWAANPDINKAPESYHMLFEDYPFHHAMMKGYKERRTRHVYVLEGQEKKIYDEYLFNKTEFRRVPAAAQAVSRAMEKYVVTFSFSNFGGLQTVGDTPLSEANLDILSRFGKVFDLTYTRFNDLKQAEAQGRESQIQLALERVRARTMAMQKSDELPETSYLLFQQVKELGLTAVQNSIGIVNEETGFVELSTTVQGRHLLHTLKVPIDDPYVMAKAVAAWKAKRKSLKLEFKGQELKNYNEHRNSFFETKVIFPEDQWIVNIIFFSKGWLSFSSDKNISEETFELLKRFAAVFEQTYTRFSDLKQAEEQARESQIQLAMERVRARTMAMQRSDELPEAANLLFLQVQSLGMPAWSAGYCIWDDDKKAITLSMSSEGVLQPSLRMPLTEDPSLIHFLEAHQRGETFFVEEVGGEALKTHYVYLRTLPGVKETLDDIEKAGFPVPTFQIFHCAYFSKGFLLFITYEPVPEAHDIFKRFAKVFEQTYTRFLDLQKAEAQARESKIEAALEKVRGSAMAMHNSNDISSTTTIIFVELKKLGIQSIRCGIGLLSKNSPAAQVYAATTSPDGELATLRRSIQMTDHPALQQQYESWLKQENYIQELKQDELRSYYQLPFFYSSANYIPPENFEQSEFGYYIPFSEGVFYAWTKKTYSDDEINILNRFKTIVDLTFRRYLDLQKAEAQAREARIEAALERVRSRTMAMQRSAELAEVATVLFQQVKALGVPQWTCGFGIFEIDDKEFTWYQGSENGDILPPCKIPLTEHPVFIQFNESRKRGDGLYIYEKTGEIQEDHYRYMCSLPVLGKLLQARLDAGMQFPAFQIDHIVNFSHGNLVFITYEHFPEMHDVFKRFAKVFDQTYTRFLDLQKSEAQAREAIKQASVDRVRAEIASMRTTSDLERITPLVWNELKTLGVSFIRCGVFIIDEEQQQVHTFLSTPDGKANASFTSAISTVSIIAEALPYWRRKEMYKAHWDEATFIEQTKHLVEQGAVSSTNTYLTENRPKNLYLHLLPFLQGILYVGNDSPLNDEELQLVQNLADAFAIAYARYEDFNKLELAKEQIENTLVDLKQTQAQLVQSEKMASLGELTAGIAHEIQNPLNFVNNFSEVNKELLAEMNEEIEKGNYEEVQAIAKDVTDNEEKISHHGKRADAIVKGMLQHSRTSSGIKEPADINALADEYLRLAYHGLRAKDKSFNATMKTEYDEKVGKINVVPQDVGRSVLNLITNAFYAVAEKKKQNAEGYEPTVTVTTKRINGKVEIRVADNGNGIPQKVLDKIFQPFFTTKPTGHGTGLGLSLSYDIIKAHGGEINVETKEGEGSEFFIFLPANN